MPTSVGQYVAITKSILNLIKLDVDQKLNDTLRNAIDPKALEAQLPKQITGAGVLLDEAKFVSVEPAGTLGAEVLASLKLTSKNTKAIAQLLYDEIKKKAMGQ